MGEQRGNGRDASQPWLQQQRPWPGGRRGNKGGLAWSLPPPPPPLLLPSVTHSRPALAAAIQCGSSVGPRRKLLTRDCWAEVVGGASWRPSPQLQSGDPGERRTYVHGLHGPHELAALLKHHGTQRGAPRSEYAHQFARRPLVDLPEDGPMLQQQENSRHPLYSEAPLTFWRHRQAHIQGATAPPLDQPSQPFRRNAVFTCPPGEALDFAET